VICFIYPLKIWEVFTEVLFLFVKNWGSSISNRGVARSLWIHIQSWKMINMKAQSTTKNLRYKSELVASFHSAKHAQMQKEGVCLWGESLGSQALFFLLRKCAHMLLCREKLPERSWCHLSVLMDSTVYSFWLWANPVTSCLPSSFVSCED
jgi:hypothetical protein